MKRVLILCVALCLAFASQAAEFLYGPYVQALTEDSAYIVWITDKATYGWVEVKGEGDKAAVKYTESHLGLMHNRRVHRVPVKNLKAGTTYEYEIFSQEEKGGKKESPISKATNVHGKKFSFRTNDRNKDEISFVMITDIHYNHVGARHSYTPGFFETLITPERLAGKDFIAFNGDMVTTMSNEKSHFEKLFTTLHNILDVNNTPFYYVRGNHEARGNYAQKYMELYPTWTGMPYYMFRQGPVCFVALDCGEDKPDSDMEYSGLACFDQYRTEQAEWLRSVVASEEFRSAPVKIVFCHIPPETKGWHGAAEIHRLFVPILNEAGIDLWISGHIHKYRLTEAGVNGCNFPVLCNPNLCRMDVTATANSVDVKIFDTQSTLLHTYQIKK